jgi:hypothetical protein
MELDVPLSSIKKIRDPALEKLQKEGEIQSHENRLKENFNGRFPVQTAFRYYQTLKDHYKKDAPSGKPDRFILFFFQQCERGNHIQKLLQLPLDQYEKESLVYFLREHNPQSPVSSQAFTRRIDLLFAYYLQFAMYQEAIALHEEFSQKSASTNEREELVKAARILLPNQKPLPLQPSGTQIQGHMPITSIQSVTKKKELSLQFVATPYKKAKHS